MIQKLLRGNYIEKNPLITTDDADVEEYRITFDGLAFSYDGGYQSHYERLANQRKIQNLKDWLLAFGSLGAAIAAAALLIFHIYK